MVPSKASPRVMARLFTANVKTAGTTKKDSITSSPSNIQAFFCNALLQSLAIDPLEFDKSRRMENAEEGDNEFHTNRRASDPATR